MKTKLFLFTFCLLSLTLIISCNKKSDTLNTETKNTKTMNKAQLTDFGKKYAAAWCSQKPESVAAFLQPMVH